MVSPKVHRSNGWGQKTSTAAAKNNLKRKGETKEIASKSTIKQKKGRAEQISHIAMPNAIVVMKHVILYHRQVTAPGYALTGKRTLMPPCATVKHSSATVKRSSATAIPNKKAKDDRAIDDRANISDDALQTHARKPRRAISFKITGIPCPEGCSEKGR